MSGATATAENAFELADADLAQVIEQSKQTLSGGDVGGRPPKYQTDEERRAARRAQDREYKKRKRSQGASAGGSVATSTPHEDPPAEPKPAGMAPLLSQYADVPVFLLRDQYGLSAEELPAIDEEPKAMLVSQVDLTIGMFCPNAANNKWVMLGSCLAIGMGIYGRMALAARSIAADKYFNSLPRDAAGGAPSAESMAFPSQVV